MLTQAEKNERQKQYRLANGDAYTKKYEKTVKGFLMRMYRNMQSRITGIQASKAHLYEGKELWNRDEFYAYAFGSPEFYSLFGAYQASDFSRKLTPSIDRLDSSKGYSTDNVEWVTHSENSRRGANSRHKQ